MAVKDWFKRLQPVQLYLVLFTTMSFFIVEIVASQATHSLTLLLNAYHMLCNNVALIGCIASIKYAHRESCKDLNGSRKSLAGVSEHEKVIDISDETKKSKQSCPDKRMKNTFGWARIDILTMLVCCVLLTSFCFSLLVEALQTLVHIDHLDEMHHPLLVMSIGFAGILLNVFCYIIIGGYTFNQGMFLHVTKEGRVVLQRNARSDSATEGDQKSSCVPRRGSPLALPSRPGIREMLRDVMGCILVVIASAIIYLSNAHIAKFIDPIFAIVSAILLLFLSYPYMRESGLILLQTIPNHINIYSLKKELLAAFPGIVNVHDLHVWHLAGDKVICTAHIIFFDPMMYARITDQITSFFMDMGVTQVTIQPEFHKMKANSGGGPCLIRCQGKHCKESQCCNVAKEGFIDDPETGSSLHKRFVSTKEIEPMLSVIDADNVQVSTNGSIQAEDCTGSKHDIPATSFSINRIVGGQESSIFEINVEVEKTMKDSSPNLELLASDVGSS